MESAVWNLAALSAFFVKGLCGFANTLVFTTVVSFSPAVNRNISPVELLLGYPTNLILAWRERRAIRWRVCLPLAGLVIAGSIPGALLLRGMDSGPVKALFGAVILLIGLEMLLRESHPRPAGSSSRAVLAVIGVLSGVLCGLYGIGALLGAYVSRVTGDSHAFKANICVVFLVENTFRIILYTAWGILTPAAVRQAAILIPAMLLGLGLGIFSSRLLNERRVKQAVVVMLMLSGGALLFNNL